MTYRAPSALKAAGAGFALALCLAAAPVTGSLAQTEITVGNIPGNAGFFLPSYIALDKGFFEREGLEAKSVAMGGKALVTAGLGGAIDFLPIPGGGSQAALKGGKLTFVVGEALASQWVIVTAKDVEKVEDLKGKTLAYGRPGAAAYDEGEITLSQFFDMKVGRDYNVINFQDEPARIAALIAGDVDGALVTMPHAARAAVQGFKPLIRTGDYLPRVGGTFWTRTEYYENNPDTVKRFIRAIAKAEEYLRHNREGSVEVIMSRFGIKDPKVANVLWDQLHDQYGPDIPEDLLMNLFESRVERMISAGLWPKDKPIPDPEQFVGRGLLTETLREVGYYLQAPPRRGAQAGRMVAK